MPTNFCQEDPLWKQTVPTGNISKNMSHQYGIYMCLYLNPAIYLYHHCFNKKPLKDICPWLKKQPLKQRTGSKRYGWKYYNTSLGGCPKKSPLLSLLQYQIRCLDGSYNFKLAISGHQSYSLAPKVIQKLFCLGPTCFSWFLNHECRP